MLKSAALRSDTNRRSGSTTDTCRTTRSVPARNVACGGPELETGFGSGACVCTTAAQAASARIDDARRTPRRPSGQVEANGILHPVRGTGVFAPAEHFAAAVQILDAGPRAVAEEPVQKVDRPVLETLVDERGVE